MVAVFAVIHELKPRIVFEPQVVQLGIFLRCRPAFRMDVDAERISFPNTERVMCRLADFDCRVALLTKMNLADRFDVFRTEIAHHFRPENARCASTADTMNAEKNTDAIMRSCRSSAENDDNITSSIRKAACRS